MEVGVILMDLRICGRKDTKKFKVLLREAKHFCYHTTEKLKNTYLCTCKNDNPHYTYGSYTLRLSRQHLPESHG